MVETRTITSAPALASLMLVALGGASPAAAQTCPCPAQNGTNYRSIGIAGVLANAGNGSVGLGSTTVTFSAPLPANVGQGDELRFTGPPTETLYVLSRDSASQVTLQSPATVAHTSQNYQLRRAYNDLPTWENARDGNLVGENRSEVGVAYADVTPAFILPVVFDQSTTDATHTMTLTVPPGQRHAGNATSGAILDTSGANADSIEIHDDYVTVEWLVVKNTDPLQNGVRLQNLTNGSNQIIVRNCVFDNVTVAALRIFSADTRADIYNNIISGGGYGIRMPTLAGASRVRVWNNSIYNTFSGGIVDAGGANPTVTLENNIVMNTVGLNYSVTGPATANNNTDEDGSAPGTNTITTSPALIWQAPGTNFHLRTGTNSQADSGVTVSAFAFDIDGQLRPGGVAWDRGADERLAATTYYRSIGTAADYTAGTITVVNGSDIVDGTATTWRASNRGRGDRILINGVNYVVLTVISDTQLRMTTPYAGATATYSGPLGEYLIARQFNSPTGPADWEDCIDGGSSCGAFPSHPNGNMVSQGRSEVGIVYEDSMYTRGCSSTPLLRINGATTDAQHTITLTADGVNRHNGTSGINARFRDGIGCSSGDLIEVSIGWVTIEWLELFGDQGGADGIEIQAAASGKIILRNNLIHDVGAAIQTQGSLVDVDIYNNFLHDLSKDGLQMDFATVRARILNNTVFNTSSEGFYGDPVGGPYATVLLRNNIVHTTSAANYNVPGFDPASGNNISGTGDATAPGAGSFTNVCLSGAGCVNFVSATDLHLQSTSFAIDKAANLSSIFGTDVDEATRVAPWDIGADEFGATTAVALLSFEARSANRAVELSWETGSELDNLGFHLYRSTSEAGPFARLTPRVVPGLGSSPAGARYRFRDSGVDVGVTYFYQLEDIETTGASTMHGPVSATPSSDQPENPPAPPSLIAYGNPQANRFFEVQRTPRGVVVELVTEGFYAEPQEDGTVVITIPGLESFGETGAPVLRPWVETPAGTGVELASVRASSIASFSGLHLSGAEVAEIVASGRGTVRAVRRRRHDADRFGEPARGWARLLTVGYQSETLKAQLELAPLRWNAARELVLARRLTVELTFSGATATRDDDRRRRRGHNRSLLAQLVTSGEGLHVVPYEELFRGGRALPAGGLRLSRLGRPVAVHIEPPGRGFGPGSRLYFMSEGGRANPYGDELVYELDTGVGSPMDVRSAAPSGQGTASSLYLQTDDYEADNYYQPALLDAPDLWFWDLLMAPQTKSFAFRTRRLAEGSSRLTVWLQGGTDFHAHPDHHVRAFVNGAFAGEVSWNGKTACQLDLTLAPGILTEGDNYLEIENVGDTEAPYSMVMLDRFRVIYPRESLADSGRLKGSWLQSTTATVSGLDDVFLLDVSGDTPRWLEGGVHAEDGTFRFTAEAERDYLAVSRESVRQPVIRSVGPPRLRSESPGADYLVIGPSALSAAASPLIEHRAQQGLRVKFAALEDVYREFGFGETRPEAIKDFVSYAYQHWREPRLRYVLLLGDATYDFKDRLGTGVANQLPPLMVKTSYLWTVSDPTLAAINGEDPLPDLAIGRLPAGDALELQIMVSKILAYENGDASRDGFVLIVTDNPDRAGDFASNADEIENGVLSGREVRRVRLDELGVSTRGEILRGFDDGPALVSYIGHGGIHVWADENVLDVSDVRDLAPAAEQPLVLTMNCLNGYFHFPYFDSLSEELLKAEGRGAIAAFSPSGLSLDGPAHRFHKLLLDALFHRGHVRLGDAVLAAQDAYAASGAFPELLSIYHLLGDPALSIRP